MIADIAEDPNVTKCNATFLLCLRNHINFLIVYEMHQKHYFKWWCTDVNCWRLKSHHGVSSIKEDSGCGVAWTVDHLNNRKPNLMKVIYVRYGGPEGGGWTIEPYKATRKCFYLPLWKWGPQWNCPVKSWKTALKHSVNLLWYNSIFYNFSPGYLLMIIMVTCCLFCCQDQRCPPSPQSLSLQDWPAG